MHHSRAITRKSASNLALAFVLLPRAKRDAMAALYAFCREVDDVADKESRPAKNAANNWPPGAPTSAAPAKIETPQFAVNREFQPVIRQISSALRAVR